MEFSLQKRRKITLLFLLGVGIPSLVLGYLAFRGIRNEQALMEQRLLGEHRTLARFISDTVAAEIFAADLAVARALANHNSALTSDARRTLSELKQRQQLIDEVFYFEDTGTIRLPAADLLYQSDGSETSAATRRWPPAAAAFLQTGQQLEFRQRRYREAETSYRRVLSAVSDPVLQGEALIAIARVLRKAGQIEAALNSCETLLEDYSDVRTTAGLPVGPIRSAGTGLSAARNGRYDSSVRCFCQTQRGAGGGGVVARACPVSILRRYGR